MNGTTPETVDMKHRKELYSGMQSKRMNCLQNGPGIPLGALNRRAICGPVVQTEPAKPGLVDRASLWAGGVVKTWRCLLDPWCFGSSKKARHFVKRPVSVYTKRITTLRVTTPPMQTPDPPMENPDQILMGPQTQPILRPQNQSGPLWSTGSLSWNPKSHHVV